MAFLQIDGRGFFYVCEGKRKGKRVVRKKLAYLGRMIVPGVDDSSPIVRSGERARLIKWRSEVVRREAKPTLGLALLYCRIVSEIPAFNWQDSKIVDRAKKGLAVILRCSKSKPGIEADGQDL